jgi:hypothetical protein
VVQLQFRVHRDKTGMIIRPDKKETGVRLRKVEPGTSPRAVLRLLRDRLSSLVPGSNNNNHKLPIKDLLCSREAGNNHPQTRVPGSLSRPQVDSLRASHPL